MESDDTGGSGGVEVGFAVFEDLRSPGLVYGGQMVRNSPGVEPRAMPVFWIIMELIGAQRTDI